MDWNVKFDDEIREINCCNGLFKLIAFRFENSSVYMKTMDILQQFACIKRSLPLRLPML